MALFKEKKSSNLLPGKNRPNTEGKTLLIDADTLVYAVCSVLEYGKELLGREFYTEEEYSELKNHPNYDRETNSVWEIDLEQALVMAAEKIETLQTLSGCKDVELHFTGGKNFRFSVWKDYKANRKSTRYPVGLTETKTSLLEAYGGENNTGWEADDMVCMLKREYPDKYIVCAVDKDVLKGVPGVHFNYYQNEKYNIPMKWVITDELTALKWPYLQCLMGDSSDGITGVPKIGPKKAEKLLDKLEDEYSIWKAVKEAYKKAGLEENEAIRNMRLVSMHQLTKDKELKLWVPPLEKNDKE